MKHTCIIFLLALLLLPVTGRAQTISGVITDESKLNGNGEQQGKSQTQPKQQQQGKKKKKKVPNLKANMNNPNNPAYKKRMQELGKL